MNPKALIERKIHLKKQGIILLSNEIKELEEILASLRRTVRATSGDKRTAVEGQRNECFE